MSSIVEYTEGKLYFSYGYWGRYSGNPTRCIRVQVWKPTTFEYNPTKNGWYGFRFLRVFDIDMTDKNIMAIHTLNSYHPLRGKKYSQTTYRFTDRMSRPLRQLDQCPFWNELILKYYDSTLPTNLTDAEYQELSTHPALT